MDLNQIFRVVSNYKIRLRRRKQRLPSLTLSTASLSTSSSTRRCSRTMALDKARVRLLDSTLLCSSLWQIQPVFHKIRTQKQCTALLRIHLSLRMARSRPFLSHLTVLDASVSTSSGPRMTAPSSEFLITVPHSAIRIDLNLKDSIATLVSNHHQLA